MNNFYKKFISVTLLICMIFSLVACSTKNENNNAIENTQENAVSPEEVIEMAKQNLKEVSSLEFQVVEDIQARAGFEKSNSTTTLDAILFKDPMKMKLAVMVDEDGDIQKMNEYVEKIDDNITMYFEFMGNWYKQPLTEQDISEFVTEQDYIFYMDMVTELKENGTEKVNGESTTRYDGIITGENMKKLVEEIEVEDLLIDTDLNIDSFYQDISNVPIYICVNQQGYPVKLELDLKDMIKDMSQKLVGAGKDDMDVSGASMEMKLTFTCQNFNNATDFEIPEEAINGEEV